MATKGWRAREAAAQERNQHLHVDEDIRAQRAALLEKIRRETGRGHEVPAEPMPSQTDSDPDGVALMTSAKQQIVARRGKVSKEPEVDREGALVEE